MDKAKGEGWQIDRHIPVAWLIGTIAAALIQGLVIVRWADSVNTRLDGLEKSVTTSSGHGERITRMEIRLEGIGATLGEIKEWVKPSSRQASEEPRRRPLNR